MDPQLTTSDPDETKKDPWEEAEGEEKGLIERGMKMIEGDEGTGQGEEHQPQEEEEEAEGEEEGEESDEEGEEEGEGEVQEAVVGKQQNLFKKGRKSIKEQNIIVRCGYDSNAIPFPVTT